MLQQLEHEISKARKAGGGSGAEQDAIRRGFEMIESGGRDDQAAEILKGIMTLSGWIHRADLTEKSMKLWLKYFDIVAKSDITKAVNISYAERSALTTQRLPLFIEHVAASNSSRAADYITAIAAYGKIDAACIEQCRKAIAPFIPKISPSLFLDGAPEFATQTPVQQLRELYNTARNSTQGSLNEYLAAGLWAQTFDFHYADHASEIVPLAMEQGHAALPGSHICKQIAKTLLENRLPFPSVPHQPALRLPPADSWRHTLS